MSESGQFYDVTVLLPVTVRLWAESEYEARRKYAHIPLQVSATVGTNLCVGFPETMTVSEVEQMSGLHLVKE